MVLRLVLDLSSLLLVRTLLILLGLERPTISLFRSTNLSSLNQPEKRTSSLVWLTLSLKVLLTNGLL
jgi:hypothetical protein